MQTNIRVTAPNRHRVMLKSDEHIGTITCNEDVIRDQVRRVRSKKNFFVVGGGDLCDAIESRDRRFSIGEHAMMMPTEQYDRAVELHASIADRYWCQIEGNHDWKLYEHGTGSLLKTVFCKPLGIRYGDYASVVTVNVPDDDLQYKLFVWHGNPYPRSAAKDPMQRYANVASSIQRILGAQMSDCHVMAMGHIHRVMAFRSPPETALYTDEEGRLRIERGHHDAPMDLREFNRAKVIPPDRRWYAVTGTAKRSRMPGVVTWEERMGFPPADLGWVELEYDRGKLSLKPVYWDGRRTKYP